MSLKKYISEVAQAVQEALPISTAREYRSAWDPSRYEQMFMAFPAEQRDRRGFRLYLPYAEQKSVAYAPPEIAKALSDKGYEIADYAAGLARTKDGKRQMRIGRILADKPDLQQRFTNDPKRTLSRSKGKLVVISRHPYDVAGMSTDRGWTSCMELTNGSNRHYVLSDVEGGTIVAYLIHDDDKNIKSPISRLLIKPYIREDGTFDPSDFILVASNAMYGTSDKQFKDIVDSWVSQVTPADKDGLYCLNKSLYNDGDRQNVYAGMPELDGAAGLAFANRYLENHNIEPPRWEVDGDEIILERWNDLESFCSYEGDDLLEYLIDLRGDVAELQGKALTLERATHALSYLPDDLLRQLAERFKVAFAPANAEGHNRMLALLVQKPEVVKEMADATIGGRDLLGELDERIDRYIELGWYFEMSECWLSVQKDGDGHYDIEKPVTLRIRSDSMLSYVRNHLEDPNGEELDSNDLYKLQTQGYRDTTWSTFDSNSSVSDWRGEYSDDQLVDDDGEDTVFGSKNNPKVELAGDDDDEDPRVLARAYEKVLRGEVGSSIEDDGQGRLFDHDMRHILRLAGRI